MRARPADHAYRMHERQGVGIARPRQRPERGLVPERANGEVREQKAPRFLVHEGGRLAAQDAPRASSGAGARVGSRIEVTRRSVVSPSGAPSRVYAITRTAIAVRSALRQWLFQRSALRYEPSA